MGALPKASEKASFKIESLGNNPGHVANDIAHNESPIHASRKSLLKRSIDVFAASSVILFTLPFLVFIAAAIRLQDGGNSLFVQKRIGYDGKTFNCLKFRTMVTNAEQKLAAVLDNDPKARREWETMRKLEVDPRVTWIGRFLRKSSLDELPQLFNVLRGDMSLVGPRPIVDEEISLYGDNYQSYTAVRPGISGLWQISGRSDLDFNKRVEFDKQYHEEWSLLFDIQIMLRTIPALLSQSGAR